MSKERRARVDFHAVLCYARAWCPDVLGLIVCVKEAFDGESVPYAEVLSKA